MRRPRPRLLAAAAAALAAAAAAAALGARPAWLTTNEVIAGETEAYPEIRPAEYPRSPDEVYAALLRAAAGIPRWRVARRVDGERRVEVEVRTALFGFTDDLSARVEPVPGGARVRVRSASRVGRGDLGENARHIAALLRRLAAELR